MLETPTHRMHRYAEHLALPPYRYLPGRNPHPFRHRDGHQLRADSPQLKTRRERLLYALDLFNSRFFWEAHEAWETQWHVTTNECERALLKCLIQLAAGHLKHALGETAQAARLYHRAAENLAPCAKRRRVLSFVVAQVEHAIDVAPTRLASGVDPWLALHFVQAAGRRRRNK